MATIEVFWGDEPDEQSERDFLAQLKEDLASRNISATILANFYTNTRSRQIDFLIATENHACVVELKNYAGVLIGGENGQWSKRLPDGTLEVLDPQNPHTQPFPCNTAITHPLPPLANQP